MQHPRKSKEEGIKRTMQVYFAGKFTLTGDVALPLGTRLSEDYRARLLGSGELLVKHRSDLFVLEDIKYGGPFYCEEASEGVYTSTDCTAVLRAERASVVAADCYVAVFGESFSVGTVVELCWAIELGKKIVILYKEQSSRYSIASEYWFAIADAVERGRDVTVKTYGDEAEIPNLLSGILTVIEE